MSECFVGEIRAVGFTFAPTGWALCNGQILLVRQYTPLFSILGNTYGGDGQQTFALPNLQGRFPAGAGAQPPPGLTGVGLGETGGAAEVALTYQQLPTHSHGARAVAAGGDVASPAGAVWAQGRTGRAAYRMYSSGGASGSMAPTAVAGGGVPHNNLSPYLAVNFIIALTGEFPPRP